VLVMRGAGNWIACQSMDNQIVVYSTKERFRVNHKKIFSGHHNAGYACQVSETPSHKTAG
jgi:pre-mRNA-processing factor 17